MEVIGLLKSKLFSFVLLTIICNLIGCSSSNGEVSISRDPVLASVTSPFQKTTTATDTTPATPVKIFDLNPGSVILMEFDEKEFETSELQSLECGKRTIPFFISGSKIKAYFSESYFSSLGPYECRFNYFEKYKKDKKLAAVVNVVPFSYPEEHLKVDKKRVFLSRKNLARVEKESKLLHKIYANSPPVKMFSDDFFLPLNSPVTSFFGTKRLYNRKKKSQHLGTDFRAKVGVPVKVSNSGKVVFAGALFFTGNTVIVDHGMQIFTIYAHLSKIKVKTDVIITKGKVVGLSGRTGRVSGPHLHWGVKVQDNWVDGRVLSNLGSREINNR